VDGGGGGGRMRLSNAPTPKKHYFCRSVATFSPHVLLITVIDEDGCGVFVE